MQLIAIYIWCMQICKYSNTRRPFAPNSEKCHDNCVAFVYFNWSLAQAQRLQHFVTPQFFSPLRPLIFLRAQSSEFIGQFLHDPCSEDGADQWMARIVTHHPIRGQKFETQPSSTTRLPYCVVWLPGFRGNDFNVIFTRNFSFQTVNTINLPRQFNK